MALQLVWEWASAISKELPGSLEKLALEATQVGRAKEIIRLDFNAGNITEEEMTRWTEWLGALTSRLREAMEEKMDLHNIANWGTEEGAYDLKVGRDILRRTIDGDEAMEIEPTQPEAISI